MVSILMVDSNRSRCAMVAGIVIMNLTEEVELLRTSCAEEALFLIYQEERYFDLIFLASIQKEGNGFRLAEQIRKEPRYKQIPIVFITERPFHGLAHISHNQTNSFLINPLLNSESEKALSQFLESLVKKKVRLQESRAIYIHHLRGETFLNTDSILFLEVRNKDCYIYTEREIFQCKREGLSNFIERLDVPYIKKCHRCFAVNTKKVRGCTKLDRRLWTLHFNERKDVCYVSATFYEEVKKQCHFIP
ncbi:LytR/AlgR family response regulator transcription factor [Anaerovorax sp. IOR16]|uniref:LytR/AlgR family response regulator transcription factor n=1 Tax=Anaerovorax sp. IOR16 TaxID=2773458 RepID=UPI0019D2B30C|nr:LytTR family transcriptional regulator DNA-binding domain-containing protein [Anaerovorax sp. IOR16]